MASVFFLLAKPEFHSLTASYWVVIRNPCSTGMLLEWASGAVVVHPSPMREVRGLSPTGTRIFEFEWDARITWGWRLSRPLDETINQGPVCMHSEHQARTIKILQSLCVSHKIVETCRNQHAPKFSKGKWNDAPKAALTSLISGCDTFWEQARTSAKRHEQSTEWICALYKCSINQSSTKQATHFGMTTRRVTRYSESMTKCSFFTRSTKLRVSKLPLRSTSQLIKRVRYTRIL
jgi:hypothetical protein